MTTTREIIAQQKMWSWPAVTSVSPEMTDGMTEEEQEYHGALCWPFLECLPTNVLYQYTGMIFNGI